MSSQAATAIAVRSPEHTPDVAQVKRTSPLAESMLYARYRSICTRDKVVFWMIAFLWYLVGGLSKLWGVGKSSAAIPKLSSPLGQVSESSLRNILWQALSKVWASGIEASPMAVACVDDENRAGEPSPANTEIRTAIANFEYITKDNVFLVREFVAQAAMETTTDSSHGYSKERRSAKSPNRCRCLGRPQSLSGHMTSFRL